MKSTPFYFSSMQQTTVFLLIISHFHFFIGSIALGSEKQLSLVLGCLLCIWLIICWLIFFVIIRLFSCGLCVAYLKISQFARNVSLMFVLFLVLIRSNVSNEQILRWRIHDIWLGRYSTHGGRSRRSYGPNDLHIPTNDKMYIL